MNILPPFALLILLIPGVVWLLWFAEGRTSNPSYERDPVIKLADMIGISLALPPLVGLAAFYLDSDLPGWALVGIYAVLAFLALIPIIRYQLPVTSYQSPVTSHQLPVTGYQSLIPLLLFTLILAFRFYQARALALPAWVDSLHHTLIVRLMLETGGVPQTLEPYIQAPFYYHFGFHINTALYAFFTRLPPERAVLVFGQVLNAVVSLAIYRLGMALWGDWRRAGTAMLLVGFVFQMPAYYVTWGRYTLLTGLILLILAMAAALETMRRGANRERVGRLAVLTGGLLLTHYFAAILLALFFVMLVVERAVFGGIRLRELLSRWKSERFRGVLAGAVVGALLAAPWVWRVWQNVTAFVRVSTVTPGQSLDEAYFPGYLSYLWYLLGPKRSHTLLIVGLVSLFLIGWREKTRPFAVWAVAFGVLSLPWGVNLVPFRPDHGVIVAFLPAAILAADAFLSPLGNFSRPWFGKLTKGMLIAALVGLLAWGVWETRTIVNPVTVLATQADVQAMEWIRQNTPEDAVFFTNVALWQEGAYRGLDGGWWITPLTGRTTLLPPVLYIQGAPDYVLGINDLAGRAAQIQGCAAAFAAASAAANAGDEFWALVEDAGITHVYLGPE
ncbi:MAG: DUF6541 family protein, partial [Anaerolineales bacterium]